MNRIAPACLAFALIVAESGAQEAAPSGKETTVDVKSKYQAGKRQYCHVVYVDVKQGDELRIELMPTAGLEAWTSVQVASQQEWKGLTGPPWRKAGLTTDPKVGKTDTGTPVLTEGKAAVVLIGSKKGDYKYLITKVAGAGVGAGKAGNDDLKAENATLRKRIADLEKENAALTDRLDKLKKALDKQP